MTLSVTSPLVARLRVLLNNNAALLNSDLQQLLTARSAPVSTALVPSVNQLTHRAAVEYLDDDSQVYAGIGETFTTFTPSSYATFDYRPRADYPDPSPQRLAGATLLTLTTDYTIDTIRGIVTTTVAETRGLWLVGTTYDLFGAAADGWELLAVAQVTTIDFSTDLGSYKDSQSFTNPLEMADRFRKRAWPGVY